MLPTNTYILFDTDTNGCVVVDPAYDASKVVAFIKENNLDLHGVLLTHGHFDHCGGVEQILQHKKVDVFGNSKDAEMAKNASKNPWRAHAQDCTITKYVDNLQKFVLDDFEFEVMETPGHTQGSVCYFCDSFMFSGDTLFDGSIGRTDLEGGDIQQMRQSLSKINKINFDYIVLPGHQNDTTLFEQKTYNPYLKVVF